ncbi:EI24 domain-containing protein [Bdellovibrio bacteriovorus]|uniref:EI24 domain-containing protein n=1 Tax=Bdellovibrio bacteriovorus TaxID=959 RepID=UPI0021D300B7|nr:EI24 domain-containing protein [Bdellovibrio bacteriovorus]UXR63805.1 EI24 domain-containing protein [Bdellovibrio bacteriovorus]
MNNIFRALRQSFEALLKIRMFLLILGPPVLTVLGLMILFVIFWSTWTTGLAQLISHVWGYQWIQSATGFTELAFWMAVLFLILIFIPLAYVLSVLIVSIFVMPVVLKWVGDGEYKNLEKRRGGSVVGSLWNTLKATVGFVIGFVVTLPLWFVPGCQVLVPLLLTAWLNKKVFLYDVLQDYADKDERQRIEKEESAGLYGMGLLLGLLSYIPLAFFFVPIISALSYTYYGLNALQARRR